MRRVIALTFDNLGEAADLERGVWPADAPLGRHPSVTRVLPGLLDELDACGLSATFCVEGLNCEMYPDAVGEIALRGHGIGVHGWRHEAWSELSENPGRERALLERACAAFGALGVPVHGFRPPGGGVTPATEDLLCELGYAWWSLSAGDPAPPAGTHRLAGVHYEWPLVDAYGLMESFADLRRTLGDPGAPLAASDLGDRFARRLTRTEGADVVILHPFLMLDPAWRRQVSRLLRFLGETERAVPGTVVDADGYVAAQQPAGGR
jgi:peptidoglycan/xylan/chitin deacetylase (PgdA/CDA1 family)